VDPIVLQFGRSNNSFIEELSIKAITGFTALITVFLVPMYFFLRGGNLKHDVFIQLGVAHITLIMGYCVTQNYINHHSSILQCLLLFSTPCYITKIGRYRLRK
jgi:O-antigen ligase